MAFFDGDWVDRSCEAAYCCIEAVSRFFFFRLGLAPSKGLAMLEADPPISSFFFVRLGLAPSEGSTRLGANPPLPEDSRGPVGVVVEVPTEVRYRCIVKYKPQRTLKMSLSRHFRLGSSRALRIVRLI